MFDIAPSEFLLVAFVALVVIGPKDLPKALRVLGYWVGRARAVGRQFRAGFDEMVREAELAEMEKKWKEENERIMREHPAVNPTPEALPAPDAETQTQQTAAHEAPHGDEQPPVMVEQPRVSSAHEASAEPVEPPVIEPTLEPSPEPRAFITPVPPINPTDDDLRRKPTQSDLFAASPAADSKAQS